MKKKMPHKTWRDMERYMRQRRRAHKNYNPHWVNSHPEGNTRRVMQERAGRR